MTILVLHKSPAVKVLNNRVYLHYEKFKQVFDRAEGVSHF